MRAVARPPPGAAPPRGQARDLHAVLLLEAANADQFLLDQRNLLVLGFFLRAQAADFLVELRNPLAQLRLLSAAAGDPHLEQLALADHDVLDVGIVGALGELRRKSDLVLAALLGLQPRR